MKRIILASDHAGFALKEEIKTWAAAHGIEITDLGPETDKKPVSYATQGLALAHEVVGKPGALGIGICGTGLGISYAVNRVKGIRGARVTSRDDVHMAKAHNNANILVMAGRTVATATAIKWINEYYDTKFEGGRHEPRIAALDK